MEISAKLAPRRDLAAATNTLVSNTTRIGRRSYAAGQAAARTTATAVSLLMTHKGLPERTTGQQAYGTKVTGTMRKKDPEKVLKDLRDYRIDGDRQRVLDEIESFMEVESVDDNHATVKHAYLGFVPDDEGVDRLTCELATWEMKWDKQSASWWAENWADVETIFQIDFTKDSIPWKKIRGLFCASDEQCAETIASNSRFEREFLEATAKLPAEVSVA